MAHLKNSQTRPPQISLISTPPSFIVSTGQVSAHRPARDAWIWAIVDLVGSGRSRRRYLPGRPNQFWSGFCGFRFRALWVLALLVVRYTRAHCYTRFLQFLRLYTRHAVYFLHFYFAPRARRFKPTRVVRAHCARVACHLLPFLHTYRMVVAHGSARSVHLRTRFLPLPLRCILRYARA